MALSTSTVRDLVAFWIFGLANNYAYVIMLSAAEDIIHREQERSNYASLSENVQNASVCQEEINSRQCNMMSTGAILLADILPTLIVKLTFPFFMYHIPFGIRHFFVCLCQVVSFITVAFSWNIQISLIGVAFASLGAGLGEICYLALAAHYSPNSISLWSSGTGGAGIAGAVAYAALTEPMLANLSPRAALLSMLVIPLLFAITYWFVLTPPPSVYRINLLKPSTWLVPKEMQNISLDGDMHKNTSVESSTQNTRSEKEEEYRNVSDRSFTEKLGLVAPLLRYMLPLSNVYYAEYLINQGIVELIHFECSSGFSLSNVSQYRWYQVLYQVGVFFSRSSVNIIELPAFALYMLPVLQTLNVVIFFFQSVYMYMPHIILVFFLILFEGFLGGAAYVNTFNRIHKEAPANAREFSLSVASLGDSLGIVAAGFSAIPLHNYICGRPFYK